MFSCESHKYKALEYYDINDFYIYENDLKERKLNKESLVLPVNYQLKVIQNARAEIEDSFPLNESSRNPNLDPFIPIDVF